MGNCVHNLLTEYDEVILNMEHVYTVSTFRSGKFVVTTFKSPEKALNKLKKHHYETLKIYGIYGPQVNVLALFLENININKLKLILFPNNIGDLNKFIDLLNQIVRIGELTIVINMAMLLDFKAPDKKEWAMSMGNLLLKLSEMERNNIIGFVDFSHYISEIDNGNIQRLQTYIEDRIKFETIVDDSNIGLHINAETDITDASNIKVIMRYS